ncbi:MAG: hypothetical protein M3O70_23510 [Actinomycetota bacterium]|nr:hypothetical protein [Actinomycetota bacterium]
MSLEIDPGSVTAVLLLDDWYDVERGTFRIAHYEFVDPDRGEHLSRGAPGFTFEQRGTTGGRISGPLTEVRAVRHGPRSESPRPTTGFA